MLVNSAILALFCFSMFSLSRLSQMFKRNIKNLVMFSLSRKNINRRSWQFNYNTCDVNEIIDYVAVIKVD